MLTGRLSRDDMLMAIAHVVARRGTCSRLNVGAVFSRDGRIVSTGYNGAPAGMPHCDHDCTCGSITGAPRSHYLNCPAQDGCVVAEHAERNAIAWAARHGLALEGTELHVTHAPCLACARTVINAGITRVAFQTPYRIVDGLLLLQQAGVEIWDHNLHSRVDPQIYV